MGFRFALAPLLRLRQSVEKQRSLALQEASLRLTRAQEARARLESYLADSGRADAASLAAGRTAAELQFASLLSDEFHRFRRQLQAEIRLCETLRGQAADAYQQAYREREVLEMLRARQHRAYQREQSKRLQQELDAGFLQRRWLYRDG